MSKSDQDADTKAPLIDGSYDAAVYLYAFAAIAVPSIAPFTVFVMKPTNDKLHGIANASETAVKPRSGGEFSTLVSKWYWLNLTRAVLSGVGALAATWAVVSGP